LTWDETVDLLSNGRHKTQYIASVVKPATGDENGPNGYNNVYEHASQGSRFAGPTNPYSEFVEDPDIKPADAPRGSVWYSTTGWASNGVLASSFNKELAAKVGEQIGEEGLWSGHAGLLGSGFNIQRTNYSGRNAEYFSEDAMLTGLIGAPKTEAIESNGVHCFVKHFALNESETGRHGVQEWISEQALRENYFRAFEIVFEEGKAYNVMTAFNRIGTTAVANSVKIANILRNEFGMPGIIETDYAGDMTGGSCEPYVSRIVNVYTGASELNETNYGVDATDYTGGTHTYADYAPNTGTIHSGKLAWAMRSAAKSILKAALTSEAINGFTSGDEIIRITPPWQVLVISGEVATAVLFGAAACWVVLDLLLPVFRKKKEA
jgi:beta-glucosidase